MKKKTTKNKQKKKKEIDLDEYSIFDLINNDTLSEEDKIKIIELHDKKNSPVEEFSTLSKKPIPDNITYKEYKEQTEKELKSKLKELKKEVGKKYSKTSRTRKLYNKIKGFIETVKHKKEIKKAVDINNLERLNIDKLTLKKGQIIKIKGIQVMLETDIVVSANRHNLTLIKKEVE